MRVSRVRITKMKKKIHVSYRFFFLIRLFLYILSSIVNAYIYAKSSVDNNNKILHFGKLLSACVCLLDIILIKSVTKIAKL